MKFYQIKKGSAKCLTPKLGSVSSNRDTLPVAYRREAGNKLPALILIFKGK